jgi:tripeptidyl-peptidase-1
MSYLQSLLLSVCEIAVSALDFGERVRMESYINVFQAPNWAVGDRVTSEDMITIRFILRHDQHKVAKFEKLFYDISNPQSPNYGKWLSIEEVTEKLAPAEMNRRIVKEFLASYGVTDFYLNKNKDIIRVQVPATLAEQMFDTVMHRFHYREDSGISLIRVVQPYSLPFEVAEVVSFIGEIIRLPKLSQKKLFDVKPEEIVGASSWNSCGIKYAAYTNPGVLQERYGYSTVTSTATGNKVAVAEFQNQYWDSTDLTAFSSACGLSTISVTTQYGTNSESYCTSGIISRCVESLLDIEYIGAISGSIPVSVYYLSTYSLYDWVEEVGDNSSPEYVHSVSYGNDEAQQTSNDYMYSCNTAFMQVGSRGISILFASGDQGVWGREGTTGSIFHPDFPAGSPYVTAVGGTDFATASTVGTETAWSYGGGGFSDTFAIPSYQSSAVASFFKTSTNLPASRYYNSTGRGYPDVSALAGQVNAYLVSIKGGSFTAVAGTSAASPVVAGIFGQLNNVRIKAGKSSLGFLNQFIYQNSAAFNDVTSGNNNGDGTTGFTAIAGWDPATGFGTPNFSKLSAAALKY